MQENQEEIIPVSKKLDFSLLGNNRESQKPDEQETMYIKALWECIQSDNISMSFIQRKLSVGYNHAGKAIEWMEKNGYITTFPNRRVTISKEEFIQKFGDPNKETDSEEDERQRHIEERRCALMERLKAMEDKEEEDEESDDENNEDDGVDDEDEFEAHMNRMLKMMHGDNVDDEDEMPKHLMPFLVACFEQSMRETGIDGKYVLAVNDTSSSELQFINNGHELRISDRGETLKKVSQTKRKIKNLLKGYAPVALDGEEICVEIKNPSDSFKVLLTLYAAIDAAKKLK